MSNGRSNQLYALGYGKSSKVASLTIIFVGCVIAVVTKRNKTLLILLIQHWHAKRYLVTGYCPWDYVSVLQ